MYCCKQPAVNAKHAWPLLALAFPICFRLKLSVHCCAALLLHQLPTHGRTEAKNDVTTIVLPAASSALTPLQMAHSSSRTSTLQPSCTRQLARCRLLTPLKPPLNKQPTSTQHQALHAPTTADLNRLSCC